ncbi:hypothetical protein Ais01nite_20290 [Asanoa ishikariensis]|uniref:Uncharacterized protein n=1 Tax=Asanoa ishikariensis TaxID=137265 RepID=A0A1H3UA22_9ACTN|nr:hypothetical protein Ais01nite_20290 [Asanoa ishikariensis]SDZ59272.1 hypothetical protein SAMN05421684_6845 [Asanoa ishikariensis]
MGIFRHNSDFFSQTPRNASVESFGPRRLWDLLNLAAALDAMPDWPINRARDSNPYNAVDRKQDTTR